MKSFSTIGLAVGLVGSLTFVGGSLVLAAPAFADTATISFSGNGVAPSWNGTSSATITATASQTPGGPMIVAMNCTIDGVSQPATLGNSQQLTVNGDGAHTVACQASTLLAANSQWYSATVQNDDYIPTVAFTGGVPFPGWNPGTAATVTVTGTTGGGSSVASTSCSIDGGVAVVASGPSQTVTVSGVGRHSLSCTATSGAGVTTSPTPTGVNIGATPANSPTWPSGAFAGLGGDPTSLYNSPGIAAFDAWRGYPADTVSPDYCDGGFWSNIENCAGLISHWTNKRATKPYFSVPMFVTDGSGSYAQGATGAYNSHYLLLAQNLVKAGLGNAGVRLGWEFNGGWYPWHVSNATDAANFAAEWRQIVTTMRSVPGAHFTFDWCPVLDPAGVTFNPVLSYPGDSYVDEIGLDTYDFNTTAKGVPQSPAARWNSIVNDGYGLQWQANFAGSHGKPIAFPEWGLAYTDSSSNTDGGGDDPAFVQNMFTWFQTHNVAWEAYFDADNSTAGQYFSISTTNGHFPQAAATYLSLF